MTILYQATIILTGGIVGMKVSSHVVPAFWAGFGTMFLVWLVGLRR
jgi:hypothetical protein